MTGPLLSEIDFDNVISREAPQYVFADPCVLVAETAELYKQDGKALPVPLSDKHFVNAMQEIA